jgi:hypothetical protein
MTPNCVIPGTSWSHFGYLVNYDANCVLPPAWHQVVIFWSIMSNTTQVVSLLAPAGHILVVLVNHDTKCVPLAPAGHILVILVNHDVNFVPPGTSWSHFGDLGQL